MICPECSFDDREPIAMISGFQTVWPWERAEVMKDLPNIREKIEMTKNGILQAYHISHLAGAVSCVIDGNGWMKSTPIGIDMHVAGMN